MNKTDCYKCDREPSVHCGECPVWLADEAVSEKERIAYQQGFKDGVKHEQRTVAEQWELFTKKFGINRENNERSCSECERIDTCKDKIDARTIDDDIKYGMVVPNYIPGPNAECLLAERMMSHNETC